MKEISYIPSDAYAAGEMKHGPIALLDESTPVVCVATDSPILDKVLSNVEEVRARGADVISIATEGTPRVARGLGPDDRGAAHRLAPAADRRDRPAAAPRLPRRAHARAERRPAAQPRQDRHGRVASRRACPSVARHRSRWRSPRSRWRACGDEGGAAVGPRELRARGRAGLPRGRHLAASGEQLANARRAARGARRGAAARDARSTRSTLIETALEESAAEDGAGHLVRGGLRALARGSRGARVPVARSSLRPTRSAQAARPRPAPTRTSLRARDQRRGDRARRDRPNPRRRRRDRGGGVRRGHTVKRPRARTGDLAVVDGFVVLAAPTADFEAAVDASRGDSLDEAEEFADALGALPAERLAAGYVDLGGIAGGERSPRAMSSRKSSTPSARSTRTPSTSPSPWRLTAGERALALDVSAPARLTAGAPGLGAHRARRGARRRLRGARGSGDRGQAQSLIEILEANAEPLRRARADRGGRVRGLRGRGRACRSTTVTGRARRCGRATFAASSRTATWSAPSWRSRTRASPSQVYDFIGEQLRGEGFRTGAPLDRSAGPGSRPSRRTAGPGRRSGSSTSSSADALRGHGRAPAGRSSRTWGRRRGARRERALPGRRPTRWAPTSRCRVRRPRPDPRRRPCGGSSLLDVATGADERRSRRSPGSSPTSSGSPPPGSATTATRRPAARSSACGSAMVGLDLIEIERLERALERRPALAERMFSDGRARVRRARVRTRGGISRPASPPRRRR